jgi:CubicO group peptidase (beta-lactamase class C family)
MQERDRFSAGQVLGERRRLGRRRGGIDRDDWVRSDFQNPRVADPVGTDGEDFVTSGGQVAGDRHAEMPELRRRFCRRFAFGLLGLVIERATGLTVSKFMEQFLWQPMGAVAEGTWSLDSEGNGFEKMESELNARALDMAKIGLLYLHGGALNGNRIVSERWAQEATAFTDRDDPSTRYQYQWWTYSDPEIGDWFAAQGNKGQVVAVFPSKDLVLARFGIEAGDEHLPRLLLDMARSL